MHNFIIVLRKRANKKDDALSYLLKFTYCLLSNSCIRSIGYIFFPILITMETLSDNFKVISWYFILTCGVGIFFIYAAYLVDKYNSYKWRDIKMFQSTLEGLSKVCLTHAENINKQSKDIYQRKEIDYNDIVRSCGFQSAAALVCKIINNKLKDISAKGHNIAVYQLFPNDHSYCMIAGVMQGTSESEEEIPDDFGNPHKITKNTYHAKIFKDRKSKIRVLIDIKEIEEKLDEDSRIRKEQNIAQCIIIPHKIEKELIYFLQIEVCEDELFGSNKEEIKEFVKNVFCPYMNYLHVVYETNRMHSLFAAERLNDITVIRGGTK